MPIKHILLAILVAVVWGCNFIFVKLGVHEIPPLFLCAVRFFLASIPALFFVPSPKGSLKLIALYGLVMFAMQFSLIFIGISLGMATGITSLLLQTSVFFSIIAASLFIGETPTLWQSLGAVLSFTGVIIASTHVNHTSMPLAGFLFILGGALAWGLGNLISRKLGHIHTATLVSWGCLMAFPPLLIVSLLVEGPTLIMASLHHVSWVGITALFYIIYISTWIGYGIWSWLLGQHSVASVVPFSLLVPIVAMICSVLFLHEIFEPWKFTVSGFVIAGLCVNLFAPRLLEAWKRARYSAADAQPENNDPLQPSHSTDVR